MSVSIPSPSGLLQNGWVHRIDKCRCVSIPSPSGLLQNRDWEWLLGDAGFNPFSFRSPSKPRTSPEEPGPKPFQSLLLQVSFKTKWVVIRIRQDRFNPFSFRSPSKRPVEGLPEPTAFQSLLLQVSFKTRAIQRMRVFVPFQSLLLQVSFKTWKGGKHV